jgi:hypothetical protein
LETALSSSEFFEILSKIYSEKMSVKSNAVNMPPVPQKPAMRAFSGLQKGAVVYAVFKIVEPIKAVAKSQSRLLNQLYANS